MSKDKPEKYYPTKFLVEGSGQFPIDMLRYDRCCPATESDSNAINRQVKWDGEKTAKCHIELIRYSSAGKSGPNVARWASFGWKVLQVEYSDGTIEKS
jgi:hypothetical protein